MFSKCSHHVHRCFLQVSVTSTWCHHGAIPAADAPDLTADAARLVVRGFQDGGGFIHGAAWGWKWQQDRFFGWGIYGVFVGILWDFYKWGFHKSGDKFFGVFVDGAYGDFGGICCSPPARWGLLDFKIALRAFSSSSSSPPRQLLIAVGTAGLQLPAPDPDSLVGAAGPQQPSPDSSGHCWTSTGGTSPAH